VLPTDDRYLSLYEEQKIALFKGIMHNPDQSIVKIRMNIFEEIDKIKNTDYRKFLKPGTLKTMRATYSAQGINEEEAEKLIENFANVEKSRRLTEIKEKLN
jgi:hypothetical protein